MTAAVERIRSWLEEGKRRHATHMLIICDEHDPDEFPVYVNTDENVKLIFDKWNSMSFHKIMEVYSLKMDIEMQLQECRAFHLD